MKKALILALDMGTSSVRAMIFDARGRALPDREAQSPYAQRTTADGGVEADAETLLGRTLDCVRDVLRRMDKTEKARLAGVGISCFWHSLIGVGPDGRAVTPVYSWADTRSREQAERLRQRLDAADYHSRTGCEQHPCFWPAKLLWLQETQSDLYGQVDRWMSFGEYLHLRLFGSANVSLSMASGTGLLDQNAASWDAKTLHALSLPIERLNPIVDREVGQYDVTKEFGRSLGPLRDLPWFPALGDGACSNAGSGGVDASKIVLNIGTSAAIRVMRASERMTIPSGLFCYRADGQRYLVGGAFASGGNVYAWNAATLQLGERRAMARRLAEMPPDGHGLTVLPLWAGERSPGWHADARAVIAGMNLHTTPLDLLRASLEAVAYQIGAVYDRLAPFAEGADGVIASGGALVHDPTWAQIIADVLGVPLHASRVFEASSRGAAIFALQSLGLIDDLSAPPLYLGKTYKPDAARHAVYRKARERYQSLYQKMLDGA